MLVMPTRGHADSWSSGHVPVSSSGREAVVFVGYRADAGVFESSRDVRSLTYQRVDGRPAPWLAAVLPRLLGLVVDGLVTSTAAIEAFDKVMLNGASIWGAAPEPFVAPLTDGGLSLDFKGNEHELELDFRASGEVTAYYFDQVTEWEGPFKELPDGIERWAWRLSA